MTWFEALTWPGSWTWPWIFAGFMALVAHVIHRQSRREDREWDAYQRHVAGREALAERCTHRRQEIATNRNRSNG